MSVHERFDLAKWVAECGLGPLEGEAHAWAAAQTGPADDPQSEPIEEGLPVGGVCGPGDLAVIEQIRAGLGVGTLGPATPTDVFVWALGEPSRREATKIGGAPYRPASAPWPKSNDGAPMELLAQVCFADSKDVVSLPGGMFRKQRGLPGDVLLVFAPGDYLADWDDDDQQSLVFEWQPLGLTDLVRPGDAPPGRLTPVHGQIHRTADFDMPPDGHPIYNLYSGKSVGLISGTKIGGVPSWGQGDPGLPGAHLCTIGSVNPVSKRYPLLNVAAAPERKFGVEGNFLIMGDMGSLYLFVDGKGRVRWTVQGG